MATVPPRPKSVAVDTNVLFDLADKNSEVEAALKVVRRRLPGVGIVVTPTVVQELSWLSQNGDPEARRLAAIAAGSLLKWGITPINCRAVMHGIIEQAAGEIIRLRLMPPSETHDALIVAEASSAECAMLISSDRHMWGCDFTRVNEVLVGRHLFAIVVLAPWKVVRDYSGQAP